MVAASESVMIIGNPALEPVFAGDDPYGDGLLFPRGLRSLSAEEISVLEGAGCRAETWSTVRVAPGFDALHLSSVRFHGHAAIGSTGHPVERAPGLIIPSGLHDVTVADCAIADGVLVDRVGLLHRAVLFPGAVVTGTTELSHEPGSTFGNGQVLGLICSPGGRPVAIDAGMAFDDACRQAAKPSNRAAEGAEIAARWASDWSRVGGGSRIEGCGRLQSVWIGPGTTVRGALSVERSTILSSADRPSAVLDGVILRDSVLQWGVRMADGTFVARSMVFEGSVVERHGIVQGSVIGPDCVVAEGEISKSLVGPLVGFHHQALLVSAYWPEGRGNVGFGANVGSNHTGRAPDQEIRPGEGAFFGLGVNVKFPTDWTEAPYLLLASATDTLPQRITLPFSLVAAPSASRIDRSPALNEIFPGWMLSDNPYALLRNEMKFAERHRALRSRVDTAVFGPRVVRSVIRALEDLESLGGREAYGDRDLAGIGKNVLTEPARLRGVAAYRSCLRRLALAKAAAQIVGGRDFREPWDPESEPLRTYLGVDAAGDAVVALRLHLAETRQWADSVEACKRRDDERGDRIIDDHAAVHPPASSDPVVGRARDLARQTEARVRSALSILGID